MSVPESTLWPIEPHTEAKHKILRKYLDAWFPIMAANNGRIVYLDGFSGPGRYAGGEPGSPIVALQSAQTHRAKLDTELVFTFIEGRQDRADHLSAEIEKLQCPATFGIEVKCGLFAAELSGILEALDRGGNRIAPTFAMIDPFGFSGMPYALIKRLLSKDRCEVFISFMVDSINRWLNCPNDTIRAHIAETCGSDEPFHIAESSADRVVDLKNLYHRQLGKIAAFVRSFELRDKNDRVVYYLFFASNNAKGHQKMKEAMWNVDPLGDFSFSDATNPDQSVLFANAPVEILKRDLVRKFRSAAEVPIAVVESYVFDGTSFVRKHMVEVLKILESDGLVRLHTLKTNGQPRIAKTYPNDALIKFV